jgi:hypothetical protein
MFKSPTDYTTTLIDSPPKGTPLVDLLAMTYQGAREFPQVPAKFWADVAVEIVRRLRGAG